MRIAITGVLGVFYERTVLLSSAVTVDVVVVVGRIGTKAGHRSLDLEVLIGFGAPVSRQSSQPGHSLSQGGVFWVPEEQPARYSSHDERVAGKKRSWLASLSFKQKAADELAMAGKP